MLIKKLTKSYELRMYEALEGRYLFPSEEKLTFHNLQQGYQGESQLENLLSNSLANSILIMSDLRLQCGSNTFQIDSLILTGDTLYLLEIKNYFGDYKCEANRWYKLPNKEITNPLLQLQRSESLLRRWLQDNQINLSMESHLLFSNNDFFLYQAPLVKQITFPSQLTRFIQSINRQTSAGPEQKQLIQLLIAQDLGDYPHPSIPNYSYDQLKKGIRCCSCRQLSVTLKGRSFYCLNCSNKEDMEEGLLRHLTELQLLFPNKKLTSQLLYNWSNQICSMRSIKRLLNKHFTAVGQHSWVYYINE